MSKTTSQDIKATLWKAAGTFRGTIDAANYKDFVLSMLFLKLSRRPLFPQPSKATMQWVRS